jgi:hypothetical protein
MYTAVMRCRSFLEILPLPLSFYLALPCFTMLLLLLLLLLLMIMFPPMQTFISLHTGTSISTYIGTYTLYT